MQWSPLHSDVLSTITPAGTAPRADSFETRVPSAYPTTRSGARSGWSAAGSTLRTKAFVTAARPVFGSIVPSSALRISAINASASCAPTIPHGSRPRRFKYKPFRPRPYARVRDQSTFSNRPGSSSTRRIEHRKVAVIAQPAVEMKRPAPRRKAVIGHHDQRGVRWHPAKCLANDLIERDIQVFDDPGVRRVARGVVRRMARVARRATSCATPDRGSRSNRRAARPRIHRAPTSTAG